MEQVNTRLLNDEQFAEDVISFFRFLNYRISPKTGETCKTLQKIIADDVASKFNWNGVSGKLAMKEHILFSKIIYGLHFKYFIWRIYLISLHFSYMGQVFEL